MLMPLCPPAALLFPPNNGYQLACRLERRRPLTLGEATQIVRYDPGQVTRSLNNS